MTEDNKNHLSSWIRGGLQPQQQAPAGIGRSTLVGDTRNTGQSTTNRNPNSPFLKTHDMMGAAYTNPVGRGDPSFVAGLGSAENWGNAMSRVGDFFKGESGFIDFLNDTNPYYSHDDPDRPFGVGDAVNMMNPRPLIDGALGIGYDAATFTNAMAQGAAGTGYTRPEWSKNGPSFVGGVGRLGKSLYDNPLGTLNSMATGEGAFWNLVGGGAAIGKAGGLGSLGNLAKTPVKTVTDGVRAGARSLKSPTQTLKNYRKAETNTVFDENIAPTDTPVATAPPAEDSSPTIDLS